MPRTRLSRRQVSLAASAIAAVYAAGYVHTESADSLLASSTTDIAAATPLAALPSASQPAGTPIPIATVAPTALAITDGAVEHYADQHHLSWDDARAQMEATAGLPIQPASPSSTDG